ncbi:MAG: glycosyltransferase [Mucilaginibacter sp.]|nr:glycosyltransferase [Mucilaginibacter sp.]
MLIVELQHLGHEVTLFAHKDSKVSCKHIPYKTDKSGLKNDLLNTWAINKYLLKNKVDVIHSFGRLAYLLPQLHKSLPKLMSYQREPTLKQIKRAVSLSKKRSLAFTGCSDYISNKIKLYAPTFTVYNGVNTSSYQFNPLVDEDAPLVFLGRIEHIKGAHIAVEIALKTNKRLVIAGNIPSEAQKYFDTKVSPFLNDKITYIGPVDDNQKNQILGQSAALLMPILWDEPFGIVMVEAMACGTPVIALKRGAVPEVVTDSLNGYTATTTGQLIEKVALLPQIDRKSVRATVEEKFSAESIAADYVQVYQKLINA